MWAAIVSPVAPRCEKAQKKYRVALKVGAIARSLAN